MTVSYYSVLAEVLVHRCVLIVIRLPFVSARDGNMPRLMSMIHVDRMTPIPPLIVAVGYSPYIK